MTVFSVGKATISRIEETYQPVYDPKELFPEFTDEIFVCGGAQIYEQLLPRCSDLFLTVVKREYQGDAFFPPFEDKFEMAAEIRDTPDFKILHYRHR